MFEGAVVGLFIAIEAKAPMQARDELTIIEGVGVEGDRYALGTGSYSSDKRSGRHVTLIEAEAIAAVDHENDFAIDASETRRNIVTEGVPLNHLVGRLFRIGGVVLEGKRLCEPCELLEDLTRPGVRAALLHRGGLRAEVVTPGVVRVGDGVSVETTTASV